MFLIRAPRKKKKKKTKTDHVIHAPFGWLGPSYLHTTSILITLIERIFSRISSGTWIDEWSHSIKRTKLQRTEFLYHVNNATDDVTLRTWRPRWLTLCRWYPNHQRLVDETSIFSSSCAKRAELLVPSSDEFERIPVSSWLLVVTLVTQIVGRSTTTRYKKWVADGGTHVSSLRCTALECFPLFWFSSGSVGRSVQQLPAHPPGAAELMPTRTLHTHMSKCLLFISTHASTASRPPGEIPEEFSFFLIF